MIHIYINELCFVKFFSLFGDGLPGVVGDDLQHFKVLRLSQLVLSHATPYGFHQHEMAFVHGIYRYFCSWLIAKLVNIFFQCHMMFDECLWYSHLSYSWGLYTNKHHIWTSMLWHCRGEPPNFAASPIRTFFRPATRPKWAKCSGQLVTVSH